MIMLAEKIFTEADNYLKSLLEIEPSFNRDIPTSGGVYVVYDKNKKIIYIGKAVNLKRRILDDHRGGDDKMSTSTLRRSIHKIFNIPAGRPVRDWIHSNCLFSYIEIPDHDMRGLVEELGIAYLRKRGMDLLNFCG